MTMIDHKVFALGPLPEFSWGAVFALSQLARGRAVANAVTVRFLLIMRVCRPLQRGRQSYEVRPTCDRQQTDSLCAVARRGVLSILQKPRAPGFSKSLLPSCPTAYGIYLSAPTVFSVPSLTP